MARLEINYSAFGTATMDVVIPQYGDAPHHARMSEAAFYGQKFKVLYLLHAEGESGVDPLRFTLAEAYAAQRDLVVVCPTIENSFGLDLERGDPWEDFLLNGLPQVIGQMLPVSQRREDTFIAGFSMGGYAALRLALKHPGRYGRAASFFGLLEPTPQNLAPHWNAAQYAYVFGTPEGGQAAAHALPALADALGCEKPALSLYAAPEDAEAPALLERLKAGGCPARLTTLPGPAACPEARNAALKDFILGLPADAAD